MSKPIGKGDLVMVVRPRSCCGKGGFGKPFIVLGITTNDNYICDACGDIASGPVAIERIEPYGWKIGCDISRLIRIDPPALADETETEREATA